MKPDKPALETISQLVSCPRPVPICRQASGVSAGANVVGATAVARSLGPGHTVVTVLCDQGERYLSLAPSP